MKTPQSVALSRIFQNCSSRSSFYLCRLSSLAFSLTNGESFLNPRRIKYTKWSESLLSKSRIFPLIDLFWYKKKSLKLTHALKVCNTISQKKYFPSPLLSTLSPILISFSISNFGTLRAILCAANLVERFEKCNIFKRLPCERLSFICRPFLKRVGSLHNDKSVLPDFWCGKAGNYFPESRILTPWAGFWPFRLYAKLYHPSQPLLKIFQSQIFRLKIFWNRNNSINNMQNCYFPSNNISSFSFCEVGSNWNFKTQARWPIAIYLSLN